MGHEFRPPTELPAKPDSIVTKRSRRGGPPLECISLRLKSITPILGGGAIAGARQLEAEDSIRAPSIRGHLRFWWRALLGRPDLLSAPKELFAVESALWGRAAEQRASSGRSQVELRISEVEVKHAETGAPPLESGDGYALFSARQAVGDYLPRRAPGVSFTLNISAPASTMPSVRQAVQAWILFGGYGSRTRRGVGSLEVSGLEDRKIWLPADGAEGMDWPATLRPALIGMLPALAQSSPVVSGTRFTLLSGATLLVGQHYESAIGAWKEAAGWLREFRQGVTGRDGPRGRSRWPEPDKLRCLFVRDDHTRRYADRTPVWPRAEFGLPILGQFKGAGNEAKFTLIWIDAKGKVQDRMASPVIVKALPTQTGFRPCALWLSRGNPAGEVVAGPQAGTYLPNSAASFGTLGSAQDITDYATRKPPILGKTSLRQAFMDWVPGVHKVTP